MRRLCTFAFVLATLAAWGVVPRAQQMTELPAPLAPPDVPVCGVADLLAERRGLRPTAAAVDGTESYSGYQSLDETTGRRLDLQTDIRPIDRAPAASPAFVSYPAIATEEFPSVKFNAALPSRIAPGQRLDLAGVVTATDPGSDSYVALRWWNATNVKDDAVLVYLPVSSAGSFTGDVTFRDGQQGVYALQAFIFRRGESSSETLGVITPVFVK